MTSEFRIYADDLTGALDAAAPLAARFGPTPVIWNFDAADVEPFKAAGNIAIDMDTRNLSGEEAGRRATVLASRPSSGINFLKVDSLFRGNFADELAALVAVGNYRSVVVAPAFPAHGRITRDGQQFVLEGDATKPVGERLDTSIRSRLPASSQHRIMQVVPGAPMTGSGIFICDAIRDEDLAYIVKMAAALDGPLLYVGSAGLAQALGLVQTHAELPDGQRTVIAGSGHPTTRSQIDHAIKADGISYLSLARHDAIASLSQPLLVEIDTRDCRDGSHLPLLAKQLAGIETRIARPACIMVTGGDTFFQLLCATNASRLTVKSEYASGIAAGSIVGGFWDGVDFLSKSGAFGAPDLFTRFLKKQTAWTD